MRKLGEQWIEIIDGQEHMVKAVRPVELCQGCLYNGNGGGCWWKGFDDECEMGSRFIIKDLGILRDGLLPCPFCGEYPEIEHFGDGFSPITFYISHKDDNCEMMWLRSISFQTEQQAKDAWNRRS